MTRGPSTTVPMGAVTKMESLSLADLSAMSSNNNKDDRIRVDLGFDESLLAVKIAESSTLLQGSLILLYTKNKIK